MKTKQKPWLSQLDSAGSAQPGSGPRSWRPPAMWDVLDQHHAACSPRRSPRQGSPHVSSSVLRVAGSCSEHRV